MGVFFLRTVMRKNFVVAHQAHGKAPPPQGCLMNFTMQENSSRLGHVISNHVTDEHHHTVISNSP
jgi:hypothetical protein